jgi:hypothetical protein
MVRWSGGRIVEESGVLLVSGPSDYLRVASRWIQCQRSALIARATEFFGAEPPGFIVLMRRSDDEDVDRAAPAAGSAPAGANPSMALPPPPSPRAARVQVEVRVVADDAGVVHYGRVVAFANDDPD